MVPKRENLDLPYFDISAERGFLPYDDPLISLPMSWSFLDEFGRQLPGFIEKGVVNLEAKKLPIPSVQDFDLLSREERQLSWVRYGFTQSACVHGQNSPATICNNVALPMYWLAKLLNKPPILSYDAYVLNNWKRKNLAGPIKVDNLELVQTFINDADQAWFILIHVDIEYEAAMAIRNLREAVLAAEREDFETLECSLLDISKALDNMIATMRRMPEGTSPDTYHRIRPWIMSFSDVVYEGVDEYNDKSQSWRGQTGAQTSIFQSLEAGLQMPSMEVNELASYLQEMRRYMPQGHRSLIEELESRSNLRKSIAFRAPYLSKIYDECVEKEIYFLAIHLGYAFFYIHRKTSDPKGTGGSDFMNYLSKRIKERWTKSFIVTKSESEFYEFMEKVRNEVELLIAA